MPTKLRLQLIKQETLAGKEISKGDFLTLSYICPLNHGEYCLIDFWLNVVSSRPPLQVLRREVESFKAKLETYYQV